MTEKIEVLDKTVFSACLIGDKAKAGDELSFFTVPCGQHMPQIPYDATRCKECNQPAGRPLTEEDTNLFQAGQMGSAIGDARFDKMWAEIVVGGGDAITLEADVELRVAGKTMLKTTLEKLLAGWVGISGEVATIDEAAKRGLMPVPYCLVSRYDTVEARLKLTRDAKISGGPIAVRLSIAGKFIASESSMAGFALLVNAGG